MGLGKWLLLVILVGVGGWVRLAPTNTGDWHVDLTFDADRDLIGGVQRMIAGDRTTLASLSAAILATPRTRIVAGSLDAGHITYVTRSLFWGFPDYTTVQESDGQIRIWSRLRFGRSDMGVNGNRLEGWLAQFG
ncbi:MAG: DUF1499 domain-containing protein [Marinovum sp.]|nr:DUF1499 domain-containing protein [Marinovum sp.]